MPPGVLGTLKNGYAGAARGLGKGLTAAHVLPEDAPPRSSRLRHWAYSLTKVHDAVGMAALDVPWWTYSAIDEVDRWLAARTPPASVFEYGSGASTVWLARRAGSVRSVEHHRAFGESMRSTIDRHDNAELLIVPPEPAAQPAIGSHKEGYRGQDFTAYVQSIDATDEPYDLVVVDGRAREACLAAALRHLSPGGVVVFDNTLRRRYARAIRATPAISERRFVGLTPTLPYPDCTSVIHRS